jgi:hypothetical protein
VKATVRFPCSCRRASQPRQGPTRRAPAHPRARPGHRPDRPADLHRLPRRLRLPGDRGAAHRRAPPPAIRARWCPQPPPARPCLEQVRRPRDPGQPPLHRLPGLEQAAARRSATGRRRGRRARQQHALESTRPVGLVGPAHPPGAGQPGGLRPGAGAHRQPLPYQPPRPQALRQVVPAAGSTHLRAVPAAPAGPVGPRRGLLPLPLPRRVRRQRPAEPSHQRLPARGRPAGQDRRVAEPARQPRQHRGDPAGCWPPYATPTGRLARW